MKKKVFLAMLASGLIFTATACGSKKDESKSNTQNNNNQQQKVDEEKPVPNTGKDIIAEALVDGIKINNISLIYFEELSTYNATITNTTSESMNVKSVKITINDENGQEIITLTGGVDRVLAPNESATIKSQVNLDLTKAASVSYSIVK